MKRTTKILNILYCLTVLLFLLDGLTRFDIKNQFLKSFVYFGFLIGTPATLFWNLFSIKTNAKRIIGTVYPTIFLILIFIINPIHVLFQSGAWQTQKILYQNRQQGVKKVEVQIQNIGALGYNRRTAEVIYLTPLFMITNKVPDELDKRKEWIKVQKDVNRLGFITP